MFTQTYINVLNSAQMLLRGAVLASNSGNPESLYFPFVKLKGPNSGFPLCILLQWTHERRPIAP